MGEFSLKHGKAETSVNRQVEVTSKQSRMSLKFQEGWMLEAESGELLHGECTEPPGPDGILHGNISQGTFGNTGGHF